MTTTGIDSEETLDEQDVYDATEPDDGKWGALRMIGLLALLAAFAGFVYLAYMQGVRNGAVGAPPIITAEKTPFKEPPPAQASSSFDNTDMVVYDRGDGKSAPTAQTPPLVVASSSAETPTINVTPNTAAMADTSTTRIASNDTIADEIARADGKGGPVDMADEISPKPVASAPPTAPTHGAGITATTMPATTPVTAPAAQTVPQVATTPVPAQPTSALTVPAATASATSGAYVVQIASYRDLAQAKDYFDKFSAKFSDVASGLASDYQTADVPGKGTYVRVRVGPFSTKNDANSLCSTLKGRGQSCLVVKG